MTKKIWLTVLGIVAGVAICCFAVLWILTAKGFGASVGRCLVSDNGSYMLIRGNSPIVMSDRSNQKDLFTKLQTGDKILVVHDGIDESYPGGTGAYMILKLGDGDVEDIPETVLSELTELGWLGRQSNEVTVEGKEYLEQGEYPQAPIGESKEVDDEPVSYCYGDVNMSLSIPVGWKYEIEEYSDDKQGFGINFWPADETEGKIKLQYHEAFGVCGTGLTEETVTIGQYEARKGTYGNKKEWDFITIRNTAGCYVIMNDGAYEWLADYMEEVMNILDTIYVSEISIEE